MLNYTNSHISQSLNLESWNINIIIFFTDDVSANVNVVRQGIISGKTATEEKNKY